ncbi:MAG: gluconokinase [Cytophagales bacterium]|nr:gluconokinase [Armatimonadota bacterium]
MTAALLALDVGTSSTRAVLYDAVTTRAIPGARFHQQHTPHYTPHGGATLDPDLLVQETVLCAAEALERAGPNVRVLAVGVSAFWHSFVGVDSAGKPLTPILLWSDRRSALQVETLRSRLGDPALHTQRTGCPLHTSYPPGRLLWLGETEPTAWARCHRILSPAEYLFARLFGLERTTVSHSMASGSGLMDQAASAWDDETLAAIPGLSRAHLSPIGDGPVSGLTAEFREALPALCDIPWFPALGDGACSNIGCGAVADGTLALMIGTSGALRAVIHDQVPPVYPGLWRYQIDSRRYLVGGAISNGGAVWAWLKKTLHLPGLSDTALEAALATLPPDDHGLTVLPFLNGERAPLWRDDATAAILGLSSATTSLQIARAHLEAVAYRFASVREPMRAALPLGRIIGTGAGLVASEIWAQILADVLREPIAVSTETQASARGAALWAREQIGMGQIEAAPSVEIVSERVPDPHVAEIYAAGRARHEAALAHWLRD